MKSPDLTALRWFCLAIEAGNLTKAAAQAGVSVPTMSRSLKRLEAGLGFRLIHRSARTFRLTAEGERYFAQLSPVFDHLKEQVERLSEDSGELFGDIRMSCPEPLVTSLVNDWVCDFMELHPKVRITISFGLTEQHFVEDRLDLAITVRPPVRGDVVQSTIITSDMWLAAARPYLNRHGTPEVAEDLPRFDLLSADRREKWEFERGGKNLILHPVPRYCLGSMQCLVQAAIVGLGICNAPRVLVERHIESGDLVRLLENEQVHRTHIYLVLADRKLIPARVRALAGFLKKKAQAL